jgi:hypothetical protein
MASFVVKDWQPLSVLKMLIVQTMHSRSFGGKIWKKKNFGELIKKIWFRVCLVTAEMFEHGNSGENQRKRSEIFFENLQRAYKDLI